MRLRLLLLPAVACAFALAGAAATRGATTQDFELRVLSSPPTMVTGPEAHRSTRSVATTG